jgi:hypothetical protein
MMTLYPALRFIYRLALISIGLPIIVLAQKDSMGFESIFDGKTLHGWEGDPVYWRVENGCLVGEITPQTIVSQNSFIIWRGGSTNDFELKLEYRISAKGNSGINYRSKPVPGNKWALQGYQSDIDGENQWSGQNYEERGRTFLALRGQAVRVNQNGKIQVLAGLGDKAELTRYIHQDWNECHLIVKNNVMMHIINGQLMSLVIDEDISHRTMDGLLGVQVHVGPPMKVEYRNIRIKKL